MEYLLLAAILQGLVYGLTGAVIGAIFGGKKGTKILFVVGLAIGGGRVMTEFGQRIGQEQPPQSAAVEGWQQLSPAEGRFTVSMPGFAKAGGTRSPKGLTIKGYSVETKDRAYLVTFSDDVQHISLGLDAGIDAMARQYRGTVTERADVDLGGVRGKRFEIEMGEPKGFASGRLFVAGGRFYQVMALGATARASDPDVQRCLDSFQILE